MPFRLIPPGTRKNTRWWYVRGTVAGREREFCTYTAAQGEAELFALRKELELLEGRVPAPGEAVTFSHAAQRYLAWRNPAEADRDRIDRVTGILGDRLIGDLTHADLVAAALARHPKAAAATRNRETLRPAAAVLHYAANNRWCAWLRVPLFKEPRPRTRAIAKPQAKALIAELTGAKRLLLLWLFHTGQRIGDALRIEWQHVDLARATVRYHVGKTDEWREKPLADELVAALANETEKTGWLFPWGSRSGVYKWLRPHAKALGIAFTPHMARHSLGRWLNEEGASLRHIMDALDHADPKSSIRYQSTDLEVLREAGRKVGRLGGGR